MLNCHLKQTLAHCQLQLADASATLAALDHPIALIEFQPDGTILNAISQFTAPLEQ